MKFRGIEVLDISTTTIDEQRATDWMTFQSLTDFLDPSDSSKTIEGYPAPRRAVVVATV
jgi:tRNA (mo5U34)-methyltransferase